MNSLTNFSLSSLDLRFEFLADFRLVLDAIVEPLSNHEQIPMESFDNADSIASTVLIIRPKNCRFDLLARVGKLILQTSSR